MLTQCPACHEWFQVDPEDLEIAYGLVRCGECRTVFAARADLLEQPRAEETTRAEDTERSASEEAGGIEDEEWPEALSSPLFVRQPRARWRFFWWAVLVLAVLVLLAQIVNANRHAVARMPVLGSAVSGLYAVLGQPIRPRLVLARYVLSGASLNASPGTGNVLVLNGRLINRATFEQRLPLIRLRLNDRYGRVVSERLLLPSDYGAATISTLSGGGAFAFHVSLSDPGKDATGFDLVLCKRREGRVVCRSS